MMETSSIFGGVYIGDPPPNWQWPSGQTITVGCPHCGGTHPGQCWRIKSIEYHDNGSIKRIEYHQ